MGTLEIALSSDRGLDQKFFDDILCSMTSPRIIVRHESILDLLLREAVSWFDVRKPPDAVISTYTGPFQDLKIIADLKKKPSYQWVPFYLLVKENIRNTRAKFIEYGVTDVQRWPDDDDEAEELVKRWIRDLRVRHAHYHLDAAG